MASNWIEFNYKNLPDYGIEVIAFSEEWINEDFNPNGTRVGFLNGEDGFYSAKWWDYQDTYNNDETLPTHWMPMPLRPLKIEIVIPLNQFNLFEEKDVT